MSDVKPRLGKKGVAWLLGCSVEEVKSLLRENSLPAYTLRDDGKGWMPHSDRRGAELFFTVEELVALRENRRKWKKVADNEGDPALLPACSLPSWGVVAVAAELGISGVAVRGLVGRGSLPAYVLNQDETGWTRAGSPDASLHGTFFFLPEDIAAELEERRRQGTPAATSAQVSEDERQAILATWQNLATSGTRVTRQVLWQAMIDHHGWSKQRTTYNKISTVFAGGLEQ